jgi:hypothetical protein
MAIAAIVLFSLPFLHEGALKGQAEFPKDDYPVEETRYILEHYPNKHFFNHYDIGGYLVYLWRGSQKVFVDGRASSLYSEELLKDYTNFMDNGGVSLRAKMIARYYHIDGLIMPNDAKDARQFKNNPAWKSVYRGPVATIYLATGK